MMDKQKPVEIYDETEDIDAIIKLSNPDIQAWLQQYPVLSDKDFYPAQDTRKLHSGIDDISKDNNFNEYLSEYYERFKDEFN